MRFSVCALGDTSYEQFCQTGKDIDQRLSTALTFLFGQGDLDKDFTVEQGETNPFLHMGLHLGIREQVATDRPAGIRAVFEQLAAKTGDGHSAEHRMIDCLAEALWTAQRENRPPDEQEYLRQLRRLLA